MEKNEICIDFMHIIAGTSNPTSRAYVEAAKNVGDNDKALGYLKNFIVSIESVASKPNAIDKRICASKGNIRNFSGYDNIEKGMKFLLTNKTPSGKTIVNDIKSLYDSVEKYQSYYSDGYRTKNRLLILEYECAVYLIVTGLSMALAFCFDVTDTNGTTKIAPKPKAYFGATGKKISEMAAELSKKDHADYLEQLMKASDNIGSYSYSDADDKDDNKDKKIQESVEAYMEGVVDTANSVIALVGSVFHAVKNVGSFGARAIRTIKSSLFGIIPLIQSVIYLSYKRKADTVLSLEQNIAFIEQNIEILSNKQTMDPAKKELIIRRQKAKIEEYRKRAEKLRAQLGDGEREAAEAVKKDQDQMKNTDDDFVLEQVSEWDIFDIGGDLIGY